MMIMMLFFLSKGASSLGPRVGPQGLSLCSLFLFTIDLLLTVVVVALQTAEANKIGIVRRSGGTATRYGRDQDAHAGAAAAASPGHTRRSGRAARRHRHLDNRRHLGKRRSGQGPGRNARLRARCSRSRLGSRASRAETSVSQPRRRIQFRRSSFEMGKLY